MKFPRRQKQSERRERNVCPEVCRNRPSSVAACSGIARVSSKAPKMIDQQIRRTSLNTFFIPALYFVESLAEGTRSSSKRNSRTKTRTEESKTAFPLGAFSIRLAAPNTTTCHKTRTIAQSLPQYRRWPRKFSTTAPSLLRALSSLRTTVLEQAPEM